MDCRHSWPIRVRRQLLDHVVIDPRGYWAHTGEAELIAQLAVKVERARWQVILAKHLSPDTLRLVSQEVLQADESKRPWR